MKKNLLASFFLILFLSLISAPTVIMAIDENADVSLFYSIAEEEENSGHSKIKEIKLLNSSNLLNLELVFTSKAEDNLGYSFSDYTKPQLNLVSPPPEFI
ncbi:hypothetical protein [Lacinutrix undariae]